MDPREQLVYFLNKHLSSHIIEGLKSKEKEDHTVSDLCLLIAGKMAEENLLEEIGARFNLGEWILNPLILSPMGKTMSLTDFECRYCDCANSVLSDYAQKFQKDLPEGEIKRLLNKTTMALWESFAGTIKRLTIKLVKGENGGCNIWVLHMAF